MQSKGHNQLFNNSKFANLFAYIRRIYMVDVESISDIHPVFGSQIPEFTTIVDIFIVLNSLHQIASYCVYANRALSWQMNKFDLSFPSAGKV